MAPSSKVIVTATFNLRHALSVAAQIYPSKSERIAWLRGELEKCERRYTINTVSGAREVDYVFTRHNIRLMLAALGDEQGVLLASDRNAS
jgi:hypothetical protein